MRRRCRAAGRRRPRSAVRAAARASRYSQNARNGQRAWRFEHAGAAAQLASAERRRAIDDRLARARQRARVSSELGRFEIGPVAQRRARLGLVVVDACGPARDERRDAPAQPLEHALGARARRCGVLQGISRRRCSARGKSGLQRAGSGHA